VERPVVRDEEVERAAAGQLLEGVEVVEDLVGVAASGRAERQLDEEVADHAGGLPGAQQHVDHRAHRRGRALRDQVEEEAGDRLAPGQGHAAAVHRGQELEHLLEGAAVGDLARRAPGHRRGAREVGVAGRARRRLHEARVVDGPAQAPGEVARGPAEPVDGPDEEARRACARCKDALHERQQPAGEARDLGRVGADVGLPHARDQLAGRDRERLGHLGALPHHRRDAPEQRLELVVPQHLEPEVQHVGQRAVVRRVGQAAGAARHLGAEGGVGQRQRIAVHPGRDCRGGQLEREPEAGPLGVEGAARHRRARHRCGRAQLGPRGHAGRVEHPVDQALHLEPRAVGHAALCLEGSAGDAHERGDGRLVAVRLLPQLREPVQRPGRLVAREDAAQQGEHEVALEDRVGLQDRDQGHEVPALGIEGVVDEQRGDLGEGQQRGLEVARFDERPQDGAGHLGERQGGLLADHPVDVADDRVAPGVERGDPLHAADRIERHEAARQGEHERADGLVRVRRRAAVGDRGIAAPLIERAVAVVVHAVAAALERRRIDERIVRRAVDFAARAARAVPIEIRIIAPGR
jgi:hypothetical protein